MKSGERFRIKGHTVEVQPPSRVIIDDVDYTQEMEGRPLTRTEIEIFIVTELKTSLLAFLDG